jgi:thiol-disulfide isomerase/thioredoxin
VSPSTVAARAHLPSFAGATGWLDSEPLGPAALQGHVVLVNFWTLTCINWLRQEPYVRAWSNAYRDDGLVVIGVHTPEFSFEHDIDGVREATRERAIDYPVALDNDYEVWNAFANHYWPALYFVKADGVIHDQHFGEGRYEESERVIQRLLGIEREPAAVEALGVEAQADWDHLRTPETYLGSWRSANFSSSGGAADGPRAYELPERLPFNHWALAGEWTIGPENVALNQAGGSIACRYDARDAHLVLSPGAREPIPFRVRLDGEAPGPSAGVDVDADGDGLLREGRMTSSRASTTWSASAPWRSRSSSPAPRRTRSRSAERADVRRRSRSAERAEVRRRSVRGRRAVRSRPPSTWDRGRGRHGSRSPSRASGPRRTGRAHRRAPRSGRSRCGCRTRCGRSSSRVPGGRSAGEGHDDRRRSDASTPQQATRSSLSASRLRASSSNAMTRSSATA